MAYTLTGVEQFVSLGSATVTAGGTTAPSAGTSESWTISSSSLPSASSTATPPTGFYIGDTAASSEVVLVTNISGTTMTVTRGADGTTPVAHSVPFTVVQVPSGASFRVLQRPWLVRPSGDSTGADDSTAFADALAGYSEIELIPDAQYYVTEGQVVLDASKQQFLRAAGARCSLISLVGASAGAAITLKNSAASYSGISQRAGLSNVAVDGTSAAAGSVGIQAGDFSRLMLDNVDASNFTGTGGKCFHFLNSVYWTEQITGTIYATNAPDLIAFDVTGTGTGSFDRPDLVCYVATQPNQNSVSFLGATTGAYIQGGALAVFGNNTGGASDTGAVLNFTGASSRLNSVRLDVNVESDSASGSPKTIYMAAGANSILNCYGVLQFINAGSAYTGSSLNGGAFRYEGPIDGDSSLAAILILGQLNQSDPGNNGTISVGNQSVVRLAVAAARSGMILSAASASQPGRTATVINASAFSITFAATGSNVADGSSDVIAANTSATYYWDATGSLWYRSV